ncbi:MAG: ispH, partial [Phycisphaerales bacterium]|nr:ispH [Phycisphaerales bacterium]
EERDLTVIDATCPLVTKVHLEVLRFAKDGYSIVFVGHKAHDEAVGTVGEAPGQITVVESEADIEALEVPDPDRVAYVTQTTLSVWDAQRLIAALVRKLPNIKAPPREDICYATTNRQSAVNQLSGDADVVLVVGSRNSSNSQRLVDTAQQLGKRAYLIDDAAQLDPAWLDGAAGVFVTAGASAPERLVQGLLDRLGNEFDGTVETRTLVEEDVTFAAPKSLRSLAVVA